MNRQIRVCFLLRIASNSNFCPPRQGLSCVSSHVRPLKRQKCLSAVESFMLSILCFGPWKESINFEWMQHTVMEIMQMNFPLIFHFRLCLAVVSDLLRSETKSVDGKSAWATVTAECLTARNYQPRKRFRWVGRSLSFIMLKANVKARYALTTRVETGVNLSACLTRGLTATSPLPFCILLGIQISTQQE